MLKREHKEIIDKTPEFPAPFIVVVQGPLAAHEGCGAVLPTDRKAVVQLSQVRAGRL